MARNATATRTALLDAAEQLVAAHGVDALSLRAVAAAAGARNTSAAAYHFGTREQLLDALFEARMAPINERRLALLAAAGGAAAAAGQLEALAVVANIEADG
jgi:AcrR family transcriptional regulator